MKSMEQPAASDDQVQAPKGPDASRRCTQEASVSRRDFVKLAGTAAVAGSAGGALLNPRMAHANCIDSPDPKTAVQAFHQSLSDAQKEKLCFAFDHELRHRINPNWNVTEPRLASDFYSQDQRDLVKEVLKSITTEDGYEKLLRQVQEDNGGLGRYSVAIFGDPKEGDFEFEITGRHLTLRADGNSVDKTAFGGPLVYGHGESNPEKNLYYFQTKSVNEVFQTLDADQAAKALLERAPREGNVKIQGEEGRFNGLKVGDMSGDQKELVTSTLKILLEPFRAEDVQEALDILAAGGGMDGLHMAFYSQEDLNDDKVWDMWRIEGPSFVWNFRGAPHVHAYINIGEISTPQAKG